jgi:hypothetical protein
MDGSLTVEGTYEFFASEGGDRLILSVDHVRHGAFRTIRPCLRYFIAKFQNMDEIAARFYKFIGSASGHIAVSIREHVITTG